MNQEITIRQTKKICWDGPESQYSHLEESWDHESLKKNMPYTNYEKLIEILSKHENTRLFTENKQYILAEIKNQEIIIKVLYANSKILYTAHYYYKNNIIKKIVKESLGWRFVAEIVKHGENGWHEEKYIYNSKGNMIFHAVFSISNNESKWSKIIIYIDETQYDHEYFESFFEEYNKLYHQYGAYIDCNTAN